MPKDLPVRSWTEPVDDQMIVGIATCFVVRHRLVYGCGVFVLREIDPKVGRGFNRYEAKEAARERLRTVIREQHGGFLPVVGELRELGGGDGIDLWA